MNWQKLGNHGKRLGATLLTLLTCLACATASPPEQALSNADLAIRMARQTEASVHAPLELRYAEEKLARARQAVENEEMTLARRLAEEALVDARLAEEKSRTLQTQQLTQELQESIATLQQEIQRQQIR